MDTIDGTVIQQQLTVEYWRKRFAELFPPLLEKHTDMMTLAEKLGEKDVEFKGTKGYFRFQNIKQKRGSLRITAKAVQLMDEMTSKENKKSASRLGRQKIVAATR